MTHRKPHMRSRNLGLSLVELMVSMAIGLFLLTIIAMVFANSSNSQKEISQASLQIENGRYAVDLVSDDLRLAGYFGYYSRVTTDPTSGLYTSAQTTLPDPCSVQIADLTNGLDFPVQGYDSPSSSPISCLTSANHVDNTDILVVRRASTAITPIGSLNVNTMYIQAAATATTAPVIALGTNATPFNLVVRNGSGVNVLAPVRELETHIYYVSPCSNSAGSDCAATDDGGRPIPTLKRIELTAGSSGAAMRSVSLVEGVQNFQVEYGIDKATVNSKPGDGQPDESYVSAPAALSASNKEWANVMSVRMFLLARNNERTQGYTDTKSYILGGTTVSAPNDAFKRHLFSTTVRLKNPSERQEK